MSRLTDSSSILALMPGRENVISSRHLFSDWETVARRLRRARQVGLFLDYDGTLAPIRPDPGEATLPDATRAVLRRLASLPTVHVTIVSGRRVDDLQKLADIPDLRYVGVHGWQRSDKKAANADPPELLRRFRQRLESELGGFPGIQVEDKIGSVAVHYRHASPETAREARRIVREALRAELSGARLLKLKKSWEILAGNVGGKGSAVQEILEELPRGTLPIYMGDDASDEDAFAVIRQGLSVRVGRPRATHARYRLRSPAEVCEFLRRLAKIAEERRA